MIDREPTNGDFDTPPIHEKTALYRMTEDILDSDIARVIPVDEKDDRSEVFAIFLEKETDPDGDLRRNGYNVISVKRTEGYTKRGRSVPEVTTVAVQTDRSTGRAYFSFDFTVEDGYPEIHHTPRRQGVGVPDDLSGPPPITKLEALELRTLLTGLKAEL